MQDVNVQFRRDEPVGDAPADTIGRVAMQLELTFLNSAVDATGAAHFAAAAAAGSWYVRVPSLFSMVTARYAWSC